MPTAHLLDYVAGNVRSLVNAIERVGYTVEWIREPKDVEAAEVGVACHFGLVILPVYAKYYLRGLFCLVWGISVTV